MSKVYFVNMPVRGYGQPHFNISSAEPYGEFVFVMPEGNHISDDPEVSLKIMRPKLARFTADDYLVLIGHPTLIGWATALAARATGGKVKMLQWHRRQCVYTPIESIIYQ